MKKYLVLILLGLSLTFISCDNDDDDNDNPGTNINYDVRNETIQSNSSEEIFYDLENGVVKTASATDWHLAFETSLMSVTIRPHYQSTVWEIGDLTIDNFPHDFTGTDSSSWIDRHNSTTAWGEGSFNINDNGHPDYGWGSYNDVTHVTEGTRIYMYNFNNGAVNVSKQIVVDRHDITNNSIVFRVADVDGSNVQEVTVSKGDYTDKSFVYFNLLTGEVVDNQPMKNDWDLVIRHYNAPIQAGPSIVYYPVSGMMSNASISTVEIQDLEDAKNEPYSSAFEFSEDIDVIGYDWKRFVNGSYTIATDRAYFVKKTMDNDEMAVYRIVFNNFENGMWDFDIQRIKVES